MYLRLFVLDAIRIMINEVICTIWICYAHFFMYSGKGHLTEKRSEIFEIAMCKDNPCFYLQLDNKVCWSNEESMFQKNKGP